MIDTYENFLYDIVKHGKPKADRTGTGTLSLFGYQMRFDLSEGFPLVTTKKMFWKGIVYELLWMLKGDTNIQYLTDHGVHIWDEWADEEGDLGPVYGKQWRNFGGVDQIKSVINAIKHDPSSRRLIVSAWNVPELPAMNLAPCHCLFQFYVRDGVLSCQLYQRSADAFLGVPFNIASYSLLTHMVANICNLGVGEFIWTGGDCHIYSNHIEQVGEQLQRVPYDSPSLKIARIPDTIFDYKYEDFELEGYKCHPVIKAPIAV